MGSDADRLLDNLEHIPQWMIEQGKEWTRELWQQLYEIATTNPSVKVRMTATKAIFDRVYGKPAVRHQVDGNVEHRHFVLRAPPILSSAEEWERKYGDAPGVTNAMSGTTIEVKLNPVHEQSDCAVAAAESDEPA